MQFSPRMFAAAKSGIKTETRRIAHPTDTIRVSWTDQEYHVLSLPVAMNWPIVSVYRCGRLKWKVGQSYAFQPGRGKPGDGVFILRSLRYERLLDIDYESAKREGFENRDEFLNYFAMLNGKQIIKDNPIVWVVRW